MLNLDTFFSDLMKYAEISGSRFDTPTVRSILDVFGKVYEESLGVSVRVTDQTGDKRRVQFRYTAVNVPHDPWAMVLDSGLYHPENHPIEKVIPELMQRFPIWWGLDASTTHGFEKIWPFFGSTVSLEELCTLPSIPDSLKTNMSRLSAFAPGRPVSILALDFVHKSFNIYPQLGEPGATYNSEQLKAIFNDLGFALPPEEELASILQTITCYYTFRWDAPDVQRVSFTIPTPPEAFPTRWSPPFQRFLEQSPFQTDRRIFVCSPTYTRSGMYVKVDADYTGTLDQIFAHA